MLGNLLLLAIMLVVSALLLEVMMRLFVDDGITYELEMWRYARDVKVRDMRADLGHRHGANRNTVLMAVPVRTEEHGFRGPALPQQAPAGVARIAFVGDSTTMGWGVAEQDTFADLVVDRLRKRGRKVDGFNSGVGNYNTLQELTLYRETGVPMKPDIIVLTYFINDAEPVPTYPASLGWLDLHSVSWIVLNYRLDSLFRQFGERPDWKHYYRALYDDKAAGWRVTQKALAGFADTAKQTGATLLVFHLPELRELKPYAFPDVTDKVRKVVEAQGTPFIDLLPTIENLEPSSLWVTVPDPHPNARANAAFTGGMVQELLPVLDRLCKTEQKGC